MTLISLNQRRFLCIITHTAQLTHKWFGFIINNNELSRIMIGDYIQ